MNSEHGARLWIRVELSVHDTLHEFRERADPRAVGAGIQPGLVEQHGTQPGRAGADDVDVVNVPDVDRRLAPRAAALERKLEESRVGLLDAFIVLRFAVGDAPPGACVGTSR